MKGASVNMTAVGCNLVIATIPAASAVLQNTVPPAKLPDSRLSGADISESNLLFQRYQESADESPHDVRKQRNFCERYIKHLSLST